jgi:hypothetical protein
MTLEFSIPIQNNSIWYAMQTNDLSEKQISNMWYIIALVTGYKVSHFRKNDQQPQKCYPFPSLF